jgi:GST-like protein
MIGSFSWATPTRARSEITLEEMALSYMVRLVEHSAVAQFAPEFLAISYNNEMPALIDRSDADRLSGVD